LPASTKKYRELFHLSMRGVIEELLNGQPSEKIEEVFNLGKNREIRYPIELLSMPKGANEVIHTLSEKYSLGIATSRVKKGVWEVPELGTLKDYFKTAVTYEDTKLHKPNPEPLLFAAERLNISPDKCLYIGDVESDFLASSAAGMKFLLYSDKGIQGVENVIADFSLIPDFIETMN